MIRYFYNNVTSFPNVILRTDRNRRASEYDHHYAKAANILFTDLTWVMYISGAETQEEAKIISNKSRLLANSSLLLSILQQ